MATLDQIGSALKRAAAAGDEPAARKLAQAYKAMAVQGGAAATGQAAPAPQAPQAGPMDFLTQGLSGLNEGIAQGLGAPVDLVTAGLNLGSAGINKLAGTDIPQIEHPVGGAETFRGMLAPTIKAETDNPGLQVTRRIAQEVGAWAVPGGGAVSKAAKPLKTFGRELVGALGSGTGAALAQQVAPGNPLLEMAGQVVGGLTPSGVARTLERGPAKAASMTVDDLRTAKNDAYKQVDNSGVAYSPAGYDKVLVDAVNAAHADHISETRHPAAYSFLVDMIGRRGKPVSLTELDQLRQEVRRDLITPSYGNPAKAADAHFGEKYLDAIDNFIDTAKPGDVIAGNAKDGAAAILQARALNTRLRKAEMISDALYKAKLQAASTGSGGNLNNAIRQQIRAILTNPKRNKAFTKSELANMELLVRQDKTENLLRWLGKFSPGGNGLIGSLEVLGTLHNPSAAVLPVIGMTAKGIADAGTLRKVNELHQQVIDGAPPIPQPRKPLPLPSKSLMYAQGANHDRQPLRITVNGGAR
jgi:hypothetical protein